MYAVIMAGGGGTRLWPLSRAARPKPFLPLLDGGRSLLEATVERLLPIVGIADMFVVTDARYEPLVRSAVPSLPAGNVVSEPMARNTAAAVALAAHAIDRAADDVMVVMPADQVVRDDEGLRRALVAAAERAATGDLVTLGVEPTYPATGYGYVLATGVPTSVAGRPSFRVERFVEKPTEARARDLLASGAAFWNAGTFIWRRDALIAALDRHAPDIADPLAERLWEAPNGRAADGTPWPGDRIASVYETLRATSIDYALMEPASTEGQVAVVPMAVGWDDLGSWSALRALRASSAGGSVIDAPDGTVVDVGSRDVLVRAAGGRLVALVGVSDLVIVDTPDALLVCAPDAAQDVKEVVDRLRAQGHTELI
jgi:mannose-1-phosphate guanylyltransferase